jgi:hypothetical protein
MLRRTLESERSSIPDRGYRSQRDILYSAYDEILAAGRAIGEAFRRLKSGDGRKNGGNGGKLQGRKGIRPGPPATAGHNAIQPEKNEVAGESYRFRGLSEQRSRAETSQVFATAFEQYLHAVEEMVGKTLRGKSDMESLVALTGMLSSLGSAASRTGFAKVQRLLDQLSLRILLLGNNPRAPVAREIRLAILKDVFELRKLAGQMKHSPD